MINLASALKIFDKAALNKSETKVVHRGDIFNLDEPKDYEPVY